MWRIRAASRPLAGIRGPRIHHDTARADAPTDGEAGRRAGVIDGVETGRRGACHGAPRSRFARPGTALFILAALASLAPDSTAAEDRDTHRRARPAPYGALCDRRTLLAREGKAGPRTEEKQRDRLDRCEACLLSPSAHSL